MKGKPFKSMVKTGGLTILLLLAASGCFKNDSAGLLQNGDFEQVGNGFQPLKWKFDYWREGSLGTVTDKKVHGGRYALLLESAAGNDIRMVQTVKVKPNTIYRFSGWVATENVSKDLMGANLSIMSPDSPVCSITVNGTTDWRPIEEIFRTHGTMHEVTLALRLGYYGNNATGKAYFDDFKLEVIDKEQVYYDQLVPPRPANRQPLPAKQQPLYEP